MNVLDNKLSDYRQYHLHARDIITGFTGIIIAHADYLTGCDQYLVQPPCLSGYEWKESRWFDENRIQLINSEPRKIGFKRVGVNDNGSDIPAPIK